MKTLDTKCHCGLVLHYKDKRYKDQMMDLVKVLGDYIKVNAEGKTYLVQRHFIALHGIKGKNLEKLGFKEAKS